MIMAAAAAAPESTVGVLSSSFLTQSDERQAQMMWSMHTGDENAPWPTFVACLLGGGLHWSCIVIANMGTNAARMMHCDSAASAHNPSILAKKLSSAATSATGRPAGSTYSFFGGQSDGRSCSLFPALAVRVFAAYGPLRDSDKPGRGTAVSSGRLLVKFTCSSAEALHARCGGRSPVVLCEVRRRKGCQHPRRLPHRGRWSGEGRRAGRSGAW